MVHGVSPDNRVLVSLSRRLLLVVAISGLVAVPAVVLRALCVGRSCERPGIERAPTPFCSLPAAVREGLIDGFREQRGPDVFAVAGATDVVGSTGLEPEGLTPAWPSTRATDAGTVPLAFAGNGVAPNADVPAGTTLDAVAPTVARILGFRRPTYQEPVRSGSAIEGVATGEHARLVLEIVLKGVGTRELEAAPSAWPHLRRLVRQAGTMDADIGALPLDPAATMATIGTGGIPSFHGITGTLLRNDTGDLARAWTPAAPPAVIATLGDELDELLRGRSRIGIVATDVSDRGAIGGNWYAGSFTDDDDDEIIGDGRAVRQVAAARRLLGSGYGRDDVPDLLVVVLRDDIGAMDRALQPLIEAAQAASGGRAAVVVTSTGARSEGVPTHEVERDVEAQIAGDDDLVEATAVGGLFLDQGVLIETGLSSDAAVTALRDLRAPDGSPLIADAFPGIAITFARYC